MVLVTEVVVGSLRDVLTHFEGIPGASSEAREMQLSTLEVKMGVVQMAETLAFLHSDATLVHCGISPQAVMVTPDGSWKLAGFAHAVTSNYAAPTPASNVTYQYDDPFPPVWEELSKPWLPYTAPELVGGWGGLQAATGPSITPAADVFSTAVLLYELLTAVDADGSVSSKPRPPTFKASNGAIGSGGRHGRGEQLLPVRSNLHDYRDRVMALQHMSERWHPLHLMPEQLQGLMQNMLAVSPNVRPVIGALALNPYFQEDVLLRALRFLDTLLQRDEEQKVVFVKHLASFWPRFEDRILKRRVLPALIKELELPALQSVLLPVLLSMMEKCTPAFFMAHLLPVLAPILASAQGELLGALVVQGSGVLSRLMTQDAVSRHLLPLYARALESHGSPHVQEECLKVLQANCSMLDLKYLREGILPRVCTVCLATTTGAVRMHCFRFMACATPRMSPKDVDVVLETASQVTAVDRSAFTLVCVSQLLDTVSAHVGADATANRILPLLCPLLVVHSLSGRQFKDIMAIVQSCLMRITTKMAPDSHMSTSATNYFANAATAAAAAAEASSAKSGFSPSPTARTPAHGPAEGPKGVASWDTQVETPRAHQAAKAARPPIPAPAAAKPLSPPSPSFPPSISQPLQPPRTPLPQRHPLPQQQALRTPAPHTPAAPSIPPPSIAAMGNSRDPFAASTVPPAVLSPTSTQPSAIMSAGASASNSSLDPFPEPAGPAFLGPALGSRARTQGPQKDASNGWGDFSAWDDGGDIVQGSSMSMQGGLQGPSMSTQGSLQGQNGLQNGSWDGLGGSMRTNGGGGLGPLPPWPDSQQSQGTTAASDAAMFGFQGPGGGVHRGGSSSTGLRGRMDGLGMNSGAMFEFGGTDPGGSTDFDPFASLSAAPLGGLPKQQANRQQQQQQPRASSKAAMAHPPPLNPPPPPGGFDLLS
ncbi:hypothetical protein DUNSADRAFT_10557 [Dunaliella salina]|uniref:Protein kinase domain-containing protein n=1 Tax=Dunaliella salina TaxID=3046 RepID=A0ABQ7GF21_DUNSA|nr:hypothetical protein DUNSADRAFT_10557 [Dunaliella salina]|eukprot:KAF5833207.1 hypothetical protein DUNSADRAFT_10557 [Dunaliella salina]